MRRGALCNLSALPRFAVGESRRRVDGFADRRHSSAVIYHEHIGVDDDVIAPCLLESQGD
jgi:hypothetical protein